MSQSRVSPAPPSPRLFPSRDNPAQDTFQPVRLSQTIHTAAAACACALAPASVLSETALPPEPAREFRAAWIATVHHIDWPSRPGLPAAAQQAELRAILDKARAIGLNALLLQVRPACDAFYRSEKEPWSPYLTGTMGGDPGYDPLAFAVSEARARGLELHAWFNPYRALASSRVAASPDHISVTKPSWVRRAGSQLWLDPGASGVDDHVVSVIRDVVRRYDLDGVHLDDYFYPHPPPAAPGSPRRVVFDDENSWQTYRASGGRLSRENWRRENVSRLIRRIASAVRAEKPWLRFGVSPFGIWRPGVPEGIEADLDACNHLFADARLWLAEGWVDYLAPQLYWNIAPRKQSFPLLLDWWRSQSQAGRPVWPGIATDRIGKSRDAGEVLRQIELARSGVTSPGHIHWGLKNLLTDKDRIASRLAAGPYARPALTPVLPWLTAPPPPKPEARRAGPASLSWGGSQPARWLVQTKRNGVWTDHILPPSATSLSALFDHAAVRAVGRDGRLSHPALVN